MDFCSTECTTRFNPLNAKLKPICHLLALLGAHHIFHVSGVRVNIQKLYMVLTLLLCVVPGAKTKQRLFALHNISRLVLYKQGEECLLRGTHRVLM